MVFTRNPIRLSVVVLALMIGAASGQGMTGYGVKVGLNLANVSSDTLDTYGIDTQMRQNFVAGIYATFDVGPPVFFQPEVLYSRKDFNWNLELDAFGVTHLDGTVELSYININPFVVYPINAKLRLFAGPSLSWLMGGEIKVEVDGQAVLEDIELENIEMENMNGMDLGLIVGAGYHLGAISVVARYSRGLRSAYTLSGLVDVDLRNNVIQILVGYAL